jgi:hypothetical protein
MSNVVRDDLVDVEDHITAMLEANTPAEAVAVLHSAQRRYLGGVRLHCTAHSCVLTFAELVNHTARLHHAAGDVVPAEPDPRELGRGGEAETAL